MNFFRTVFLTCSQFRNYRTLRDVPVWTSLKYITTLITLLALLSLLSLIPTLRDRTDGFARWADRNLPAFSITNAHVKTTVAQPYRAGNEQFLFILDTTNLTRQPETNALMGLLVEETNFVFWIKNTNAPTAIVRSQRAELRGFPDGVVNGNYFRQLVRAFMWVGLPVLFLIITLIALFTVLVQAYIFALIASLMERTNPKGLRLAQLLNLAIHAATPAALIYTIFQALQLTGVDLWLIYLLIYGVFVVGAANACRERLPAEEPEEDELL
ncbi:MAG: DUF1189 family protein [Verrucomicrobiota bacterium]